MAGISHHLLWRPAAALRLSLAVLAFVVVAAPRSHACTVDDDLDVAAEGVLSSFDVAESRGATKSMSCKLLVSGPHLQVTTRRTASAAEVARADAIRARTRQALAKYQDYRVALQDGYEIRFSNLNLKRYHFSNRENARASLQAFDPARPTSLLYEKDRGGYRLIGVMFTAPRVASEAELDRRFPISVAPWHLHTNFCLAYATPSRRRAAPDPRFGPEGTIATAEECTAAGGTFKPVLFGWMTHVDLYDSDQKD
jgi:hypothetical protein